MNEWNQTKRIGAWREDLEENERVQIFYDEIWVKNGYDGEWSIPSQIGGFEL